MTNSELATRTTATSVEVTKKKVLVGKISTDSISHLERLANIQGTSLVKRKGHADMIEEVVHSNLDAKLLGYLIRNMDSLNIIVKTSTRTPVTTEYLAKKFNTTPKKVREFLKKCISHNVLCRSKKILFMNPYTYIPYSAKRDKAENDQVAHQLQTWWSTDTSSPPSVVTMSLEDVLDAEESNNDSKTLKVIIDTNEQ